jgi:hypothetical protein
VPLEEDLFAVTSSRLRERKAFIYSSRSTFRICGPVRSGVVPRVAIRPGNRPRSVLLQVEVTVPNRVPLGMSMGIPSVLQWTMAFRDGWTSRRSMNEWSPRRYISPSF